MVIGSEAVCIRILFRKSMMDAWPESRQLDMNLVHVIVGDSGVNYYGEVGCRDFPESSGRAKSREVRKMSGSTNREFGKRTTKSELKIFYCNV